MQCWYYAIVGPVCGDMNDILESDSVNTDDIDKFTRNMYNKFHEDNPEYTRDQILIVISKSEILLGVQ